MFSRNGVLTQYARIGGIGLLLTTAACTSLGAAGNNTASPAAVSRAAIPLGDDHVSTTPKVGYVYSCQTSFPPVGGASKVGPWINTANKTWNANTKVHVQGAVKWPAASYKVTVAGGKRVVKTNGLPISHTTGTFPIASADPAYEYDRNPNTIKPTVVTWTFPQSPKKAAKASCTPGGAIGVLKDGEFLFNALDGEGRDAVAHEVLGSCDDHPMQTGMLHHHDVPSCILSAAKARSTLVGYAIDGFGIYVERNAKGQLLTNKDLDACHGRVSKVLWNGKQQTVFHYDATIEYPYTVGCFEGTKSSNNARVF